MTSACGVWMVIITFRSTPTETDDLSLPLLIINDISCECLLNLNLGVVRDNSLASVSPYNCTVPRILLLSGLKKDILALDAFSVSMCVP